MESGRSVRNRPGLQRALDACRSGEADGIIAAKVDRLSQSIVDFGSLLEEARKGGFNLVALDLGVDLRTPQGELNARERFLRGSSRLSAEHAQGGDS